MVYDMDERERNELAWRAFFLGMRTALHAHDRMSHGEDGNKVLNLLGEIARGETALHEPTETAAGTGPAAQTVVGIGNTSIRLDRELAAWVVAGLDRASTVPDE